MANRSRDLEALRESHATPCSTTKAQAILRDLASRYLPAADALTFKISWGTRRGRGGYLFERRREPSYVSRSYGPSGEVVERQRYRMRLGNRVAYVSLPRTPMTLGGDWWDKGKRTTLLRVGLVLHEFAHVMVAQKFRHGGHAREFVETLDMLVAERKEIAP